MHPISRILCNAYNLLIEKGEVSFTIGEEQKRKVDSIVKTVNAEYLNIARFPSNELKAAAYLYFIIKDHPFIDGNKRFSILWFQAFCDANGLNPVSAIPLDVLAIAIEKSTLPTDEVISIIVKIAFGKN